MKYHNNNLTDVENVGEQLCRIRKEKGLTQKQAAEVTYHTRDWLSNVEIGRTPITFVDAVRQLEAYERLDEVDHLVQAICTSAGTRQSSTVLGTVKFESYWRRLMNNFIYVLVVVILILIYINHGQCEFSARRLLFTSICLSLTTNYVLSLTYLILRNQRINQ